MFYCFYVLIIHTATTGNINMARIIQA